MEAGCPRSKKRRSASPGVGEDGGGADYISTLPDAVLGDIISLLPTKEGARTRILASRWRDLWLSAPLNLDCHDLTADGANVRAAVVARILSSHRGPGRRLYVNTFSFNVPADTVEACLRSAALDNLEDLEFTFQGLHFLSEHPQRALIFRFSATLRVANICKCDLSDITFQGLHFPLLRQLGLVEVNISELSLHCLIAGCPVLECLLIDGCVGFCCVRINSFTIRSISAWGVVYRFHQSPTDPLLLEQLVIENAPCLVRLLLPDQSISLQVVIVAAPKLETLGFVSDTCDPDVPVNPFRLVFGSTVIQGLCVEKLITVVHTVKILALDMQNLSLDTVIELMRCFPCVEKLYIQSSESRPGNLWRRKHRNLIRDVDMRLKTIVLEKYQGLRSQINFVTFFVLNAIVVESVTLGIKGKNNNEEFLAEQRRKLQVENKISRDAQFLFTTSTCVHNFYGFKHVRDLDLTDPFTHRIIR